jgi:drug/metabolite transporter (DMT)-like permease
VRTHTRNLLELHFIVVIFGFTAILGRLISLDATEMIWYRLLIAAGVLGVYAKMKNIPFRFSTADFLKLCGIGVIVALHWITFFRAIKVSNVSVALGCFATTTLFASFLEPLILRRRLRMLEVLIGLIIIAGLYLIFQFETSYVEGMVTSLISAFLAVLFTVFNKKFSDKYNPTAISVTELTSGFVVLSVWLLFTLDNIASFPIPTPADWLWLIILAVVCTAYTYVAGLKVMKTISPYTMVLTINLEPVYSIILARLLFGESEKMSGGFYMGTLVILGAIFLYPWLVRYRQNKNS